MARRGKVRGFVTSRARLIIIYSLVVLAFSAAWYVYSDSERPFAVFISDFVIELVGIALTVALVDQLFVIQQRKVEIEVILWDVLHSVDYTLWVWYGGQRIFDFSELVSITRKIELSDPMIPETQNLMIHLGNKAANYLLKEKSLLGVNGEARMALNSIGKLARLRDTKPKMSNHVVQNHLLEALKSFDAALVHGKEIVTSPSGYQFDCSEGAQLWRCTGHVVEESLEHPVRIKAIDKEQLS